MKFLMFGLGVIAGILLAFWALDLEYGRCKDFAARPRTIYGNDFKHPVVHLDEHKESPGAAVNCDVGWSEGEGHAREN